MQETQDTLNDISHNTKTGDERKPWKSPELRILPVPTKTQGGPFARSDQDDRFYRKS